MSQLTYSLRWQQNENDKKKKKNRKICDGVFAARCFSLSRGTRLEVSDKILADVERDGDEAVQQEEVVEELHHEIANKIAVPVQDLQNKKKNNKMEQTRHVTTRKPTGRQT